MLSLSEDIQSEITEAFNSTSRYLDYILHIYNSFFDRLVSHIYPSKLQLNETKISNIEATVLELHLSISDSFI